MNLIEEIEPELRHRQWWPRIKAALEAAQKMKYCERGPHFSIESCPQCAAIEEFSAAMEGK